MALSLHTCSRCVAVSRGCVSSVGSDEVLNQVIATRATAEQIISCRIKVRTYTIRLVLIGGMQVGAFVKIRPDRGELFQVHAGCEYGAVHQVVPIAP
eukprot:3795490-Pleurochrysis_carterae.AAC.3